MTMPLTGAGSAATGTVAVVVLDTFSVPGSEPIAPDQGPMPVVQSGAGTVSGGTLSSTTSGTELVMTYAAGWSTAFVGESITVPGSGLFSGGLALATTSPANGYRYKAMSQDGTLRLLRVYQIGGG